MSPATKVQHRECVSLREELFDEATLDEIWQSFQVLLPPTAEGIGRVSAQIGAMEQELRSLSRTMDMKFQEAGNIAYGLMSRQQGPPEVRNLMVQLARLDDDLTRVRLEIEDQKARTPTGGIIVTDKRKGSGNGQL